MKRTAKLGLESFFIINMLTLTGTVHASEWSYRSYIDSMTDIPISYSTLRSSSRGQAPINNTRPKIDVICNDQELQVRFTDPNTILFDHFPVTYRFDSRQAANENWDVGPGQDNLYSTTPSSFVDNIIISSRLLYQVLDVFEEAHRYSFNIPPDQSNLNQVLMDCGLIERLPPIRPYNEDLDLSLESENHFIRLTAMGDGEFKYQSWSIETGGTGTPDLELANGTVIKDGTGGNHRYKFINGDYSYIVHANFLREPGRPKWEIEVKRGNESLLRDPLTEK